MKIYSAERKKFLLLAIPLSCLLLAIWLYSYRFHAFDDDEFQHLRVTWLLFNGSKPYIDFFEHHFVFYHRIFSLLYFAGEDFFQIFIFRFLSFASGLGSLFCVYLCARRIGISREAAFCATFLLAMIPAFLLKMTEVRPEAPAIFLYAAALNIIFSKKIFTRPFKNAEATEAVIIGILCGIISLLSQKFVVSAAGVLFAYFVKKGMKSFTIAGIVFATCHIFYWLWLYAIGSASASFRYVVIMNLMWKKRFSPDIYFSEIFFSSGLFLCSAAAGVLIAILSKSKRKTIIPTLILLFSSLMQVFIVPVPFRQSFLPFLVSASLFSAIFFSRLFSTLRENAKNSLYLALAIFAITPVSMLKSQLEADNSADIKTAGFARKISGNSKIFDGRGLLFFTAPVGFYPIMHDEILMMIDNEKYADEVISALKTESYPPVIYDYRVQMMPQKILGFIQQNYISSEHPDILVAGTSIERIIPGRTYELNLPFSAFRKISWKGGELKINSVNIKNGESIFLTEGSHLIESEGLVWDLKIENDYGKTK